MERILEMEEYIKEYRIIRQCEKSGVTKNRYCSLLPSLCSCMDALIKEQIIKRDTGEQEGIKYILFFHLLSSGYTGSGEVALGMSNSMIYLDDNFSCVYWKPDLIYKSIDEDMQKVKCMLQQKFLRVEEFELLYLKQKLLLDDWGIFSKIIGKLAEGIAERVLNSPLPLENELEILYGDYMDRLDVAAKIETEGERKNEWEKKFFSYGQ